MERMANPLGQRESEIMGVLWELGEASAEDVRRALPAELHDSMRKWKRHSVRLILKMQKGITLEMVIHSLSQLAVVASKL